MAQKFAENGIDVSVLPHLTDQDLKDLGVLLGHRRKMLAAIGTSAFGAKTEILRSIRGLPVVDPSETLAAHFRCDALRAVMNATNARVKFMLSAALGDLAIQS